MTTNRSQEEQANEIVREKAFLFLNQVCLFILCQVQEIPYELIFEHRGWRKSNDALILEEGLIVQSESQGRIVGKVKSRLEKAAAIDLSEAFQRKIQVHITINLDKNKQSLQYIHSVMFVYPYSKVYHVYPANYTLMINQYVFHLDPNTIIELNNLLHILDILFVVGDLSRVNL